MFIGEEKTVKKIDNYERGVAVLQRISTTLQTLSRDINKECGKNIIDPRVLVSIGVSMQNLLGGLSQIIPVITNNVIDVSIKSKDDSTINIEYEDNLKNMVNGIFNSETLDPKKNSEEDGGNLMDGQFEDDQNELSDDEDDGNLSDGLFDDDQGE